MAVRSALLLFPSSSEHVERALAGWLRRCCRLKSRSYKLPGCPVQRERFSAWVAETFTEIVTWIDEQAAEYGGPAALREFAAYIEAYDPEAYGWEDLRPLAASDGAPQVALVWMLVLAFPEVHWVFYSPYSSPSSGRFATAHVLLPTDGLESLQRLHRAGFVPLFDPGGVRDLIRTNLRREMIEGHCTCDYLPQRPLEAVALDEEQKYAFFMGYLPYRLGLRSWSVCSLELMKWRLKDPDRLALTVEDIFLFFPDRAVEESLSDLEKRYRHYKALADAQQRVLITVGHRRSGAAAHNLAFLRQQGRPFRVLYKPVTGVFETFQRAGLRKVLRWPPRERKEARDEFRGHSAPGRLLAVADVLVARSRALLNSAPTVQDAIHAAVLALDAKELLGGRTPTLALEAIALQQEAEVVAESLFLGVQHNLDVRRRLQDIQEEVDHVAQWVHPRYKNRSVLNARLSIVEQLAQRYRELNQIEEEMACLAEARKLRFEFWVRERPMRWAAWPFLRYVAFSLSSLGRFVGGVALWALFFGLSYYALGVVANKTPLGFWDAMLSSAKVFLTGDPAENWTFLRVSGGTDGWEIFWKAWVTFQGVVSFTNLSLLISHLYMIVSRR